ncbi:MATE family efflux transporter [Lachnoclostridium sp. Marseille-P6806]|uniref:MATE family efflux transporter n=1 Tax=Lachnoclostridium sp. Marseille-P6806 TaxID=2364793 RepID=UPI001F5E9EBB|nr:MATE family efflux transporter [Lachnoclostridium sp. Marseille-P6806]
MNAEKETKREENKMGVMPVKQLIVSMSLPMMISMLVQALYNVVDSIFVAQISENALTAVTLAFPLQNLMIAVGSGTGVGINALLSRSLGAKNFRDSDRAANTGILLTFFNFFLFLFIGLFFSGPFLRTQTDVEEIIRHGDAYLMLVCCGSLGLFFQLTMERLLQSTGRTLLSMISQGTGALINIIFDPIMIFGIGPFPAMGVTGAALATILGQFVAGGLGVFLNIRFNKDIRFSVRDILHPTGFVVKQIYFVGIPSILMISIGSLMSYLMNRILIAFSTTAAAVFGVYFKLQSFFFMPIFGLNNGLIPVLAYNYGARRKDRIREALRFSLTLAVSVMIIGTLTFELFPALLLRLFNASEDMLAIGVPALRIIAIHFPAAGASILMGSIFQAFARSIYSLIISIGRQLVALIPAAWLLAQTGSVVNVWWAFPIAELVSLILSICFFLKLYRNTVMKL